MGGFFGDGSGLGVVRAVLLGTAIVGTLDGLDAILFSYLMRGTSPLRVFQGVASGALGRSAFEGGWPTALIGLGFHYFIALAVVVLYVVASRRIPLLTRQPLLCGALYGVAVYLFMNQVVIPLSAIGRLKFAWPPLINGLLIHVLGVGVPAALVAARALARRGAPPL